MHGAFHDQVIAILPKLRVQALALAHNHAATGTSRGPSCQAVGRPARGAQVSPSDADAAGQQVAQTHRHKTERHGQPDIRRGLRRRAAPQQRQGLQAER